MVCNLLLVKLILSHRQMVMYKCQIFLRVYAFEINYNSKLSVAQKNSYDQTYRGMFSLLVYVTNVYFLGIYRLIYLIRMLITLLRNGMLIISQYVIVIKFLLNSFG